MGFGTEGYFRSITSTPDRDTSERYHSTPREASTPIFKIRSYAVRSELKNKVFSAGFCFLLRPDLTAQDRICKIRYFLQFFACFQDPILQRKIGS